jgi:mono/diheme cytochrome c family protein
MHGRSTIAVVSAVCAAAIGTLAAAAPPPATAALVARGSYLVNDAGKCADCHGSSLHGAKLDFLAPGLPVAHAAPRIAGLPQLSAAQAAHFLETGLLPNGKHGMPPMPQYRFHHDDAVAIVAYLKSLP